MEPSDRIASLKSSPIITRHPANPILTSKDIPYRATLIFNAGVAKYQGKYVMVFRNDYGSDGCTRFDGTNLGVAFSDDGIRWQVRPKPWLEMNEGEVTRIYDPRLTVLDGRCYMCFAMDTRHGLRGGIGVTEDFEKFEILSLSAPDNRNMVLFPERVGGKCVRLERPFPIYSRPRGRDRFDIWISDSPDLKYWGNSRLLLGVEQVPFANDKLGPAAPPIKTRKGWLTIFHGVDIDFARGKNGWEDKWQKRYTAGVMLLDLNDPGKVIGLSREPLLAPEAVYEVAGGFRNHVIFPGGMIAEDSGEVKIYYGAADTVECLATAQVDDLLALCKPL
ncbi:MAG: glycoside hydrolase family 130 protein [Candidatus Sumerlaeota bacterium]|nr:glycoside hydrolase family 130 protein [Candidatus Sumerlaeota bacterium]